MQKLILGLIVFIGCLGLLMITVGETAQAAKIFAPGGWALDYTACRNGYSVVVEVPAGATVANHEIVITDSTPDSGTPQLIFTYGGGNLNAFVSETVYFYWDVEQAVGTPVIVMADRFEDGISVTGDVGVSAADVVQDCYLPPPPIQPSYRDGRLNNHHKIVIYCSPGKNGVEVWYWDQPTLSAQRILSADGSQILPALAEALVNNHHTLITAGNQVTLWALQGGEAIQVQAYNLDMPGDVYNFIVNASTCAPYSLQ